MNVSNERFDGPFRINLEQQKMRASALLTDIHTSESHAISLFKQYHPNFDNLKSRSGSSHLSAELSDAELVIARELGLADWSELIDHIASMRASYEAIIANESSPDADLTTLHIRCGTDLKSTLPAGGFEGDFLEFSDPYCQGPILQNSDFLTTRAQFLHESYDPLFHDDAVDDSRHEKTCSTTLAYLESAYQALSTAFEAYERIVFWFEHDSYDQLILARLLAHFASHELPKTLEMVSVNHYPGTVRFIGLGQLPPEAIRLL